tara:strand:+ start:82 stop:705 length:624 start_codon:yes stop_codon:yes gene_type:complete
MFSTDYYSFYEKEKNILLEPLSCIFRMILLNYKQEGTKISILNHSIQYNDSTFYQGILRTFNGDTREDLHNLYNPLLKAFEWYPVENEYFHYFYQKCHEGITKLLKSYDKGSTIHHTLTHYCTMLKSILEKKELEEKEDENESPLLDKFRTFWDKTELIILYQTFQFLDQTTDEVEKQTYFKVVDDIITMKEKKVYDYIYKSSTAYN